MSDGAWVMSGQASRPAGVAHRMPDAETHAPYEGDFDTTAAPHPYSQKTAEWRLPETNATAAHGEPTAVAGEEARPTGAPASSWSSQPTAARSRQAGGRHVDPLASVAGGNGAPFTSSAAAPSQQPPAASLVSSGAAGPSATSAEARLSSPPRGAAAAAPPPPLHSGNTAAEGSADSHASKPAAAAAAASSGRPVFSNGAAAAAALPPPPLQPTALAASGGAAPAAAASSLALPPMPSMPPPMPPAGAAASSSSAFKADGVGGGTAVVAAERAGDDARAADPYARPAVALSANLLELYKRVNAQYCAQRRLETPGPKYNNGYDDKDGHYLFLPGEVIFQRYIAQEVLGKGSFGTVVRAFDQKRSEAVAMKITRRGSSFRSQAKLELDILLRLNENPALNHLVVRLLKVFEWQGHLVLVFELLSFNLYQLIKCTRFNGVSLDLVRKFAYQLTHTLLQLESQKPHPIIHCDLKPENILLRNQNRSGIRLIDFGSACYTAKRFHRYIQSRFYRSPEVILFLEYGTAIDRWSLACVLVELHTGVPLFDGRTEAAQLAKFECTLGPIPAEMIAASPKASRFYYGSLASGFQLKEPVPERRTLDSVIGVTTGGPRGRRLDTPGHDEKSYGEFHDFIARFLRYQPEERMSCRDALQHPFLMPLYTSDLMQQQEREAQQHRQQGATQPSSAPRGTGKAPEERGDAAGA